MTKTLIWDLECDDLLLRASKIHCVSAMWIEDEYAKTWKYDELDGFIEELKGADVHVGHNILGYDLLALRKLLGIPFTVGPDTLFGKPVKFVDTLVNSRYLNPDRPGHSLLWWGELLKYPKGEYSDWTTYTEGMAEYNRRDVILTKKVYEYIKREIS